MTRLRTRRTAFMHETGATPAVAPAVISWARMAASIAAEIRSGCGIVRPVALRAVPGGLRRGCNVRIGLIIVVGIITVVAVIVGPAQRASRRKAEATAVSTMEMAAVEMTSLEVTSLEVASLDVSSLEVSSLEVASLEVAGAESTTLGNASACRAQAARRKGSALSPATHSSGTSTSN